jgi:hypothetical protein
MEIPMSLSAVTTKPQPRTGNVVKIHKYPKGWVSESEAPRPFAIFDEKAQVYLRWHYYRSPRKLHIGTWNYCFLWCEIGTVLTAIDRRTSKPLGHYKRLVDGVQFTPLLRLDDDKAAA